MVKRLAIAGLLIIALGAGVVAWVWYPWVFSPHYTIHIATGPVGSFGQKFIAAFKREVAEGHPRVRLALEEAGSLQESAEAFQSGKFDLAVVRSDHPAAASGGTVVVLRRISLVIIVPANSHAKSMKDLVGKKIAVLEGTPDDDPLLRTVMDFYSIKPTDLAKTAQADVGAALRSKQVAAVVVIGSAGPGAIAEAVKAIIKATNKPPKLIDLEATEIAAQHPLYEEITISPGAFLAAPAIPGEDLTTVAVAIRLVAKNSMLNDVAGEITRLLLTTRAKLATTLPQAGQIEAPDTDKKGVLRAHPGAAAYIDGTQETIFDQAMNQLFNFSIIGGVLGSLALWLSGFWRRHRPDEIQKNLARLPAMMREAKSVPLDQLSAIEEELDALSGWLLERFVHEKIAPDRISGVAVIISHIRLLIERRRKLT
ncbi:TAXI family TRAP transporter solute-binding subunit [Propionivibrio sp.]|uniref:TAXI family TRAP transporter solute-binding subunit n=1 Tax=Propionivibrio sp. TaxID=2212460 RepID=UPI003BF04FDE